VVVSRDQPDVAKRLERHPLAIVSDADHRFPSAPQIQAYNHIGRIGVVRILYEFKDGQPRTADEFVAQ